MSKIHIQSPLLIATMNEKMEEISGGHILIEDTRILSIGPEPYKGESDRIIDATNMVILPGFVNTHHHFYQTLTRNIPRMQNVGLFNWLKDHYEVWRELTEDGVYVSAKVAILELMKSGTTTSSDQLYLFPRKAGPRLIDAEITAAEELGFRFQPSRGSMSLGKPDGGLPPADVIQSETEIQNDIDRLVKKYHDASEGAMIRIALAPCSPFSVTPELMRQTVNYARDHGLQTHTHLAETLDEESFCIEKYGKRPVAYVEELGWVSNSSWFAHAVHLNQEEIDLLGAANSGVAHCPSSNMRLGSGIAPIREMLDAGIRVSIAVDGSASNDSSNMLSEIRNALLLSRLRDESKWLTAREVLRMATRGGAEVLGRTDIGQLQAGMTADLALFSIDRIEYAGSISDPLAALVFNHRTSPVDYLMINGDIQIENGKSHIDENNLIMMQNDLSSKMLRNAQQNTGINFTEIIK